MVDSGDIFIKPEYINSHSYRWKNDFDPELTLLGVIGYVTKTPEFATPAEIVSI